jgi:hypothetical protein
MLSVTFCFYSAEWQERRFAECHYAECRGTSGNPCINKQGSRFNSIAEARGKEEGQARA